VSWKSERIADSLGSSNGGDFTLKHTGYLLNSPASYFFQKSSG
jgi:hypothetical protein